MDNIIDLSKVALEANSLCANDDGTTLLDNLWYNGEQRSAKT